jgi:hypothetical protein
MVRDIGLKFGMVMVFGKLEDHMHGFLSGSVHKLRHPRKKYKKYRIRKFLCSDDNSK